MRWVVRTTEGEHRVEVERSAEGFEVVLDGHRHRVDLVPLDGSLASLRYVDDGRSFQITSHDGPGRQMRLAIGEREFAFDLLTPMEALEASAGAVGRGARQITAPIPGKVVAVKVAPGDEVEIGRPLVVLEAMKMENELAAERAGRVAAVYVAAGATVEAGTVLVELE
jgi:3-methylcrotonyl-CoA carboxylase alpha subunit